MVLFEAKERTRTAPIGPVRAISSFDSSGRPEFQIYRDLVNGWIAELPEQDQQEMINRLRKNDSLGYQAALAGLHHGGNRCAFRRLQHRNDARLLRAGISVPDFGIG